MNELNGIEYAYSPDRYQGTFIDFLNVNRGEDMMGLFDFALDTLQFANKIQTYHWKAESGFMHEKLEELYKSLRDFADKLVEIAQSENVKFRATNKTYSMLETGFDLNELYNKLDDYIKVLDEKANTFSWKKSINNLMTTELETLEHLSGLLKSYK